MQRPIRFYVGGPMTGYPDFNFPAFHRAAEEIRSHGFIAFDPAEADEIEGREHSVAKTMRDFMQRDLPEVMAADAIYLLDGWEQSKGARCEHKVARTCDIPVIYEGELTVEGIATLMRTYLIAGYTDTSSLIVTLENILWALNRRKQDGKV